MTEKSRVIENIKEEVSEAIAAVNKDFERIKALKDYASIVHLVTGFDNGLKESIDDFQERFKDVTEKLDRLLAYIIDKAAEEGTLGSWES